MWTRAFVARVAFERCSWKGSGLAEGPGACERILDWGGDRRGGAGPQESRRRLSSEWGRAVARRVGESRRRTWWSRDGVPEAARQREGGMKRMTPSQSLASLERWR